jgi:hypothetical protein
MIQFEDRAVAFIDVLGFKRLVNKASLGTSDLWKLNELVALLGSSYRFSTVALTRLCRSA